MRLRRISATVVRMFVDGLVWVPHPLFGFPHCSKLKVRLQCPRAPRFEVRPVGRGALS